MSKTSNMPKTQQDQYLNLVLLTPSLFDGAELTVINKEDNEPIGTIKVKGEDCFEAKSIHSDVVVTMGSQFGAVLFILRSKPKRKIINKIDPSQKTMTSLL